MFFAVGKSPYALNHFQQLLKGVDDDRTRFTLIVHTTVSS